MCHRYATKGTTDTAINHNFKWLVFRLWREEPAKDINLIFNRNLNTLSN